MSDQFEKNKESNFIIIHEGSYKKKYYLPNHGEINIVVVNGKATMVKLQENYKH
ncbi:hypothetical protein [Brochothrix thermosphacta]|uniref:hypothetical protein n=1 Tax=Brochothrix thermosphacta TaxID=2756 RepID=UPI003F96C1D5